MSMAMGLGFYGKLPSHGDFLRRRAGDAFVRVWDGWLQDCMAASRAALGDRWLDLYLTSPVWRFGCAAGAAGASQVVGLMAPSVDRVGRYFPLTLVAELPATSGLLSIATEADAFFDRAERLLVDTLAAEVIDVEGFDEAVVKLGLELGAAVARPRVVLDPSAGEILQDWTYTSWNVPIGTAAHLGPAFMQMLGHRLSALYEPLVVWWTEGSAGVQPTCLLSKGLPHPEAFVTLLDGSAASGRWQGVPVHVEVGAPADDLLATPDPMRYRSAGMTDVGRVRSVNQDAFVERPDVGLWVVADGLGGHSSGEVASRMVCDAFADFVPEETFDAALEAARERLQHVNNYLVHVASRSNHAVVSGSTVVAFMTRGARCAILWAGDSRAYRWRQGRLAQLTRDHSVADAEGASSTAITRAVGGEAVLSLDEHVDAVQPGDRFLLCSDGLTRALPDSTIERWLSRDAVESVVAGLVQATLDAGAPDNVTVLVVDAF